MYNLTRAIDETGAIVAAGVGALCIAIMLGCTPWGPGEYDLETYSETEGTEPPPIELPLAGDQWGPCLGEDPRCYSIGECTEAVEGITMCSAPADVCPPAAIADVELPTTIMFDGTGKCVVLCGTDADCYPEVGFVCGGEVCGWAP